METARVRAAYDRNADRYARSMPFFERLLFPDGRSWVCSQASGDVLEIAVGTGANLRHYGPGVRLTAIDLSEAMLEHARARAREAGVRADLRVGDAQSLDLADESFDCVVCTISLCTIPDDRAAIGEVRRVLRPGGRFLLLEHVRSTFLPLRLLQHAIEPISLRIDGDHLTRDPLDHLRAEGFEIERCERSRLGVVERVAARKPR